MAKLIILSVALLSFAGPVMFCKSPQPRRALRRLQGYFLLFIFVWAYLCLHWYPTMVVIE